MDKKSKFVKLSNIGLDDLELYKKEDTGYLNNICYLYTSKNSNRTFVAMNSTQKVLDFYKFHSSMDKDDIMKKVMELFSDDEATDFVKAFENVRDFDLTDNIVVELPFDNSVFTI